jgi:hypothetical protein
MRPSSIFIKGLDRRRRAYVLGGAAACAAVGSLFAQDDVAYFFVVVPALVPLFIWLYMGAPGIPVLPAISGLFVIYYALPMLRSDIAAYGSQELITAGGAVGTFLLAASVGCLPFVLRAGRNPRISERSFASDNQIVVVIFAGLAGGIIYNLLIMTGNLAWLGATASVLRSVVSTLTSVACYLLGSARGSGVLAGQRWMLALATLSALIVASLGNLFLVGGFTNLLAAVFGYVISAKRIPWFGLTLAFAVASVLHAGKFEMRRMYWQPHTQSMQQMSIVEVPGMMVEWFAAGVSAIWSGDRESDVLERASLLHMVLLVQRMTPDYIPYLEGETYALLPSMLVPRFLEPEKIQSQAVLNLLSVRYGLQYVDSTASTTIGWGMVAEAYANYSFAGVVVVGFLFGAFCGFLMRLSTGAAPLSLPMFVAIAATLGLLNVEMDFSYLAVTLAQTMIAVLMLAVLPRLVPKKRRRQSPAAETSPYPPETSTLRDAHGA